jgi:hypothetical protein
MMPRPIGRGIIDLAVEVLAAYLNPGDELTRLRRRLSDFVVPPHFSGAWPRNRTLD